MNFIAWLGEIMSDIIGFPFATYRSAPGMQTVGAVTADLMTIPVPNNQRMFVEATAIGAEPTPIQCYVHGGQGAFNNAGTVVVAAGITLLVNSVPVGLVGATMDLVASGSNVIVRVTGSVGKTITWLGYAQSVVVL